MCDMCRGRGSVQTMQRTLLGQVMTARPCPQCQGYGDVLPTPCTDCAGEGRVLARRTLKVRIIAGVDTGTRIQLNGQAEVGPAGGPNGDLYVEVVVRPHPVFERRGSDLHATVTLPMTAAALGTTVELDTFDGPQPLDIAPGTSSGETVRLPGLGLPPIHSRSRGDVVVRIEVETPADLDDEQRELLRRLAELRDEEHPAPRVVPRDERGLFSRTVKSMKGAFGSR
jgi:molecular chaperone DnaJ